MLTSMEGYWDGTQFVADEEIRLPKGQRVIITILSDAAGDKQRQVDLRSLMGRGEKMFHGNIEEYVKGLKANDRI